MGHANPDRLRRLWNTDPHCYWCGRVTLSPNPPGYGGGKLLKLSPTIDHLINKRMGNGHRGRGVLACHGCNMQRARDETVMLHPRKRRNKRAETLRLIAMSCS